MTNGDKFAVIASGGFYNLVVPLPGKAIKYTTGEQCFDGDDIAASKATCRANGWLLHDATGNEITYQSTGELVNAGNVAYQNDFKQRVLNFLALHPGINGVYLDNFVMDIRNFGAVNYPIYDQSNHLLWSSPADYQAAQISFISNVGAALKAAGYLVGVNARGFVSGDNGSNDGTLTKQWIDRYSPYVTATMVEYWQQIDDHTLILAGGQDWKHQWDAWQSVEVYAQSKGIEFWPIDNASATELAQCRYLRGSYLLEWNGKGSIMLQSWDGTDAWNSCTAANLGVPSGAKYQVASGVWRRDYQNGYAIVNPTSAAVTVNGVSIASGDAVLHQN